MSFKILLIENDPGILRELETSINKNGVDIVSAEDGDKALGLIRKQPPDCVIVGKKVPPSGGIQLCKTIRSDPASAALPILILSHNNHDAGEMIRALDAGADDYLSFPLDNKELYARINALQRRASNSNRIIQVDDIKMDLERWETIIEGRQVMLTPKEFKLLRELLEAKGRVLSRDVLLERVWGNEKALDLDTRTVDVHVGRLRRKLGPAATHILTVRNIGYRIDISPAWITSGKH